MIIDGHAHTYPEHSANKVIQSFVEFHHMEPTDALGEGTVKDLRKKMKENGIAYTVLANFAPVKSLHRTNEWTVSMAHTYNDLIPLVSVYPQMPTDELAGYFRKGAKGIKMHTGIQGFDPGDPGLRDIYAFCNEYGIPITFHCGETSRVHMNEYAEMSHIIPVVKRYKNIPFVMTHLAAGDPDMVIRIAEECPNAIFDTSITLSGEHCIHRIHDNFWEDDRKAAQLFRKVGIDHFAFGSDYPFGNPGSDINRIKRLDLSDEEKSAILGLNTYRLYFENEYLKK